MKELTEPSVTTYHYEYDSNGNRTLVEIKDDGLTLESRKLGTGLHIYDTF